MEKSWVTKIVEQMNSVLVGKEEKVELVVIALLAQGHLLLEDVPGVGKTTMANALAKSVDGKFRRIQFTPDTLPSDITGVSVYDLKSGEFRYAEGVIMTNILLADEINRTSPKTQASLLEAMEEKQVTVDGIIHPLNNPFMVIATQNPVDFLGTYQLPEAQLDRFLMKISLGYPDAVSEKEMTKRYLNQIDVHQLSPIVSKEEVAKMQEEVKKIEIHEDLIDYIVSVVKATRECESLSLGASPRATLALIHAAQAAAYIKGREFVIPDDIRQVMNPVLCHRLILSMDAKINKRKTEEVLHELVRKIPIPVFLKAASK